MGVECKQKPEEAKRDAGRGLLGILSRRAIQKIRGAEYPEIDGQPSFQKKR